MNTVYKYTNLSDIQSHPDSLRLRQAIHTVSKSVWENEAEAKELVTKRIVNTFGYPHNIELHLYQGSSKTEFVNVETNEILASVETINDGTVFSTETEYYGDWYK